MEKDLIIKALECCGSNNPCGEECFGHNIKGISECTKILAQNALSLIKELTEENERLRGCVKSKEEVEAIMRATYEPLVKEITKEQADKAVADTVRKMREKLTTFFNNDETLKYNEVDAEYINKQIGQTAKEMIENNNE